MEISLHNKVALVTGTSRRIGIGAALVQALARAGAAVVATYYRPYDALMPWGNQANEVEELIAELRDTGARVEGIEVDLSDPESTSRVFEYAENTVGPVDILINNAAHDEAQDIYGLDAGALDTHYAVNTRAPLLLCREFARRHDGRASGRIINLTSGQSISAMPESIPYVVTKGAVEAATLSLSAALAPKGITVNAVDPGPTDTGWMNDELRTALEQQAPFGRVGVPEDVARLVLFLASDAGQWITGQVLRSRGGF